MPTKYIPLHLGYSTCNYLHKLRQKTIYLFLTKTPQPQATEEVLNFIEIIYFFTYISISCQVSIFFLYIFLVYYYLVKLFLNSFDPVTN
jgi:hypothetical protein